MICWVQKLSYMYVRSNRNPHWGCKLKPTNFLILHCKFSFIVLVYSPISLHFIENIECHDHSSASNFTFNTHYKLWSESRHDDDCDAQRSINLSPAGSGNLQNVNIFSLKLSVANKSTIHPTIHQISSDEIPMGSNIELTASIRWKLGQVKSEFAKKMFISTFTFNCKHY